MGNGRELEACRARVAVFLGKIWSDSTIEIWGDGTVARDFMYIKDTVDAFVRVVEKTPPSSVYNIGSGKSCSINRLLELMAEVTGKKPRVVYRPSRKFDVPEIALDIRKAEKEIGWKPETSLEEGIAKTWDWIARMLG